MFDYLKDCGEVMGQVEKLACRHINSDMATFDNSSYFINDFIGSPHAPSAFPSHEKYVWHAWIFS
jgi:hypothetical protein